jgi:hypothetical protein
MTTKKLDRVGKTTEPVTKKENIRSSEPPLSPRLLDDLDRILETMDAPKYTDLSTVQEEEEDIHAEWFKEPHPSHDEKTNEIITYI